MLSDACVLCCQPQVNVERWLKPVTCLLLRSTLYGVSPYGHADLARVYTEAARQYSKGTAEAAAAIGGGRIDGIVKPQTTNCHRYR